MQLVEDSLGPTTILVNNAGIPDAQYATKMSVELIDSVQPLLHGLPGGLKVLDRGDAETLRREVDRMVHDPHGVFVAQFTVERQDRQAARGHAVDGADRAVWRSARAERATTASRRHRRYHWSQRRG